MDEIIFTSDGLITTLGDNADGVNIEGSTVTADLNVVRTEGIDADGVEILATDGPISIDAELIETNGDLSSGTILRGTGDVTLTARAIRTGGTDAVAIDISTDAAACILLGVGGCDVTAAVDEVTTEGFGGIGALVAATGDTDIDIGILRTGGDEAAGLDLSADPAVCVVLGVGACDTAFTVGELTTAGDRSPGAIVRAVGDIDADIGVLRTAGNEAVGLDLASDPTACVILGAGACDTSFSVGELTTSGDGATGILVRAAGDTTGNVGILRTQGDDAVGIDIASDPQACLLLGAGACDVDLTAGEVSTQGDGAAAVLIDAVGNVTTDLGLLATDGANAAGLQIQLDPAVCLVLGPGACTVTAAADEVDTDGDDSPGVEVDGGEDPILVDVGDVDTDGDNSPGVDVEGTGPITVDTDNVDTGGDGSPGIHVDGDDDPVLVTCGNVTTRGDNSPGVAVEAEGQIDVSCETITTSGDNSDGVLIDGGDGTVTVTVDEIRTGGAGSDGINLVSDAGDQVIDVGLVNVTGPGSNGINAVSTECGDISITARGPITSAQGTAIFANTACAVSVTTLPGAPVSGLVAGIDVTSGTGATISVGDSVTSGNGPAIDVDGAAAVVTITPTGSVTGRIDLTDNGDVFVNNGLFVPIGISNFGLGNDSITNNGTVRVSGTPTLAGCETFTNRGLITMVNGSATDRLTLCGNFVGAAGSALAIDVAAATTGTPTDQLFIGGNASGSTTVTLNLLGGPGVLNPTGALVVDAATATANPFTLAGPVRSGFVDYSLQQRGSDTFLLALPNELAFEPLVLGSMGMEFWYQSADAWSESAAVRRNNLGSSQPRALSFWAQGYASSEKYGEERTFDIFDTSRTVNFRQETDRRGAQLGIDFATGGGMAFGLTGGYEHADSFLPSGTRLDLEGYNIGGYMIYGRAAGLYAELLAKADFFEADIGGANLFTGQDLDGTSYGAEAEVGYRLLTGGMHVDLGAGLAYVRTRLDDLVASNFRFDFDRGESLRGRLGVRVGGTGSFAPYVDAKVLHEFRDGHRLNVQSGGFDFDLENDRRGTWFRGEVGLTGAADRSGGFVSAWIERGEVKGYGLRLGFRF